MGSRAQGFFIIAALGSLAFIANEFLPGIGASSWALVLGLLVGNIKAPSSSLSKETKWIESQLLSVGIILMGFNLDLLVLSHLGGSGLSIIVLAVVLSMLSAWFIGKVLGLRKGQWLLLGFGNGICGSSAIAAASKLVDHKEEDLASSVATVNLLGTIGIVLLPAIIHMVPFSSEQGAILIGSSLQAVGHVIAAGYAIGEDVGNLATLVKMGRIALLLPALVILSLLLRKNRQGTPLPFMVWGFAFTSCLASVNIIPAVALEVLSLLSKVAITGALAAIGYHISFRTFLSSGSKTFVAGALIFVVHLTAITGLVIVLL